MKFDEWLDTLVEEKGYDVEEFIFVEGASGKNIMPLQIVLDAVKKACQKDKIKIKKTLIKIDFCNGDCMYFFKHLAGALAI